MLELGAPHRASPAWEAAPPRQGAAAKGLLRLPDDAPRSREWKALALERVSVTWKSLVKCNIMDSLLHIMLLLFQPLSLPAPGAVQLRASRSLS